MSDYTVTVTATVTTWPGNNGSITAYSIAAVFDANLPANFLSVDSTGHFIAAMRRGSDGKITSPVKPGDKITFTFGGSTGFTVTDVTGLNGNVGGLSFGPVSTSNGTTSLTATVNNSAVGAGKTHTEYVIDMKQTSSSEEASIDPDFETDVA
jgi:hypothetical protein